MIVAWLYRLCLVALTIGCLQIIYALICKALPQAFSGRQKRSIWWFFILASFLMIPLPYHVTLPRPLYDLVTPLRLAAPAADPLTATHFFTSLDRYQAQMHDVVIDSAKMLPIQTRAHIESLLPDESGLLTALMANYGPLLQRLYLLGLLAFLAWVLFRVFNRFYRGRETLTDTVSSLDAPYIQESILARRPLYQRKLSAWRDALGFYRRGKLTLLRDEDPASLIEQGTRWLSHETYLPHQPLAASDDPAYWQGKSTVLSPLAEALYRTQHPDVMMSTLYGVVRILHWINPFWHGLRSLYRADRRQYRREALARKLNREKIRTKRTLRSVGINIGLIFIAAIMTLLFLIQMPQQITLPIRYEENKPLQNQGWQINVIDLQPQITDRNYQHIDRHLVQPGQVKLSGRNTAFGRSSSVYLHEYAVPGQDRFDREFGIGFFDHRFSNLRIADQRQIEDRLHVVCRFESSDDLFYLELDAQGHRMQSFTLRDPFSGIRKDYAILADGKLLILRWLKEKNIPSDSLVQPQKRDAYFELLDREGNRIWLKTAQELGLPLTIFSFSALQYARRPSLIIPDSKKGFYLIENESWLLYQSPDSGVRDPDNTGFQTRLQPATLHHFDEDGQRLNSFSLGLDKHHLFVPVTGQVIHGKIYLAGYVRFQKPFDDASSLKTIWSEDDTIWREDPRAWQTAHVASYNETGDVLWQKSFQGGFSTQIQEMIWDQDRLSLLLTSLEPKLSDPTPGASQRREHMRISLLALDSEGQKDAIWEAYMPAEHLNTRDFQLLLDGSSVYINPRLAAKINVR